MAATKASVAAIIVWLMRLLSSGRSMSGLWCRSRMSSSASRRARRRRRSMTCATNTSLCATNSSSLSTMLARISKLLQITPHLIAELSLTMSTPASDRPLRASGVRKRFAPSMITRADGLPSPRRKSFQFVSRSVRGRPPAGMNASASSRLWRVLRSLKPSGRSREVTLPFGPRRSGSNSAIASSASTSRSSSRMTVMREPSSLRRMSSCERPVASVVMIALIWARRVAASVPRKYSGGIVARKRGTTRSAASRSSAVICSRIFETSLCCGKSPTTPRAATGSPGGALGAWLPGESAAPRSS